MCMPCQAGRLTHYVLNPSVGYQTCKRDISKMNEPILMKIGTSSLQHMGIKQSALGVRGSKVEVILGQK